jgi:hypothetical protein
MTRSMTYAPEFAALIVIVVACGAETGQTSADASVDTADDARAAAPDMDTIADALDTTATTPRQNADAVDPGPLLLTPDGWGPLRIGMSRAEVVAAAGADAQPDAVGGPDPERCDEFRPSDAPQGVLVMIESDVLTRISVSRTTDIATPAGFRVGASGTEVEQAYGARALVQDHEYQEPPARYITVWRDASPESERRGIRYEVDASDRVVHLRAGGASVEYVEGCV